MKERLLGFDLLRGLIIILMIFINLFDETAKETLIYSVQGRAIDLAVTALLPNLFIFIMGFFLVLTNSLTTKKLFVKAMRLLVIGYALNIVRDPFFMYLAGYSDSFAKSFSENMYFVHMVDLYIFAGFTCLLLIPLSWLPPISSQAYTSFAALMMYLTTQYDVVQEYLQMLYAPVANYAMHLFLPIDANTYFPLIPWLGYVFLGIACGLFYQSTNRADFFKKLALYGMLTTVCGYFIFSNYHDVATFKMFADFYQHNYSVGIMLMGLTLLMPVLSEFFLTKLPQSAKQLLSFTSQHIMLIYCLSWLLISYLKNLRGLRNSLDLQQSIVYALFIYIICLLVAKASALLAKRR